MKNLKVSQKLIFSFIIVIVLSVIVGVVGIIGMTNMDTASNEMYSVQTEPIPHLAKVIESLQRLRVNMREYAIGAFTNDIDRVEAAKSTIATYQQAFEENASAYDSTIVNAEARTLFDEALKLYNDSYKGALDRTYAFATAFDYQAVIDELVQAVIDTNKIVQNFDRCMEIKVEAAEKANSDITAQARMLLILIIAVLGVAVVVAMVLAIYISRLISVPLNKMKAVMDQIGNTGNLEFSVETKRELEDVARGKDEIAQSVSAAVKTVDHFVAVGEVLQKVANGDLTADFISLSNEDTVGLSIMQMMENLNNMFSEIKSSAAQVSTGSKQIADGAQSLAQGSTEQAAAVQQLSASISEIADKTRENARIAREAASLSGEIKENAEKGSVQMDQMMSAVQEINDASTEIEKVIKTIDDIAFQTNILALNAAVEAARAGQHGKGFAVVAEEVRNLAGKSAEAAKNTGGLIENSVSKANLGLNIATDTSSSLKEIVDGIIKSAEIVAAIAQSSDEQAGAITQVNTGIDQVAQVVQQNSATAEESAAASQEMSGQSDMLDQLISQFKIKNNGRASIGYEAPRKKIAATSVDTTSEATVYSGGNYGKY